MKIPCHQQFFFNTLEEAEKEADKLRVPGVKLEISGDHMHGYVLTRTWEEER